MIGKLARAAAVAVMILAIAVTPLNAVISSGQFDFRWPGGEFHSSVRVLVDDHTGLVREVSMAPSPPGAYVPVSNPGSNRRVLIVSVDGSSCDRGIQLVLDRTPGGYLIGERTLEGRCALGTGFERSIAIYLWSPVDASLVDFVPLD
ncbi:MAG: hypothetical protein QOJ81_1555 [Chloroflexota bacterium]|jgi:hypothetical protein|nr:hypothetical protein [Chloroflexota bacterium]